MIRARSFPNGPPPAELRKDPEVVKRATEIQRRNGFDPLSDELLERARLRNTAWSKLFRRQVVLAIVFGITGLFMAANHLFGVTGQRPIDGDYFWTLLGVNVIIVALCALSIVKAAGIKRRRRNELGSLIDAYTELVHIGQRGA